MTATDIATLDRQVRAALVGCDVDPVFVDRGILGDVGRLLWLARDSLGRRFKLGHSPGRGAHAWDAYGPASGAFMRGRTLGDVVGHLGPAPDGPQQLGLFGGAR